MNGMALLAGVPVLSYMFLSLINALVIHVALCTNWVLYLLMVFYNVHCISTK